MKIFLLACRNTLKNIPRRLPLALLFFVTIALLFLGNTVFENTERGFQSAYVDSFTGDLSFSAKSEEQFTIFGSDLPLVGDYLVLPVLPDVDKLKAAISSVSSRVNFETQVSAGGSLALDGYNSKVPVFGVNFASYFRFFPSLKIVLGAVPEAGTLAIMLNKNKYDGMAASLGRAPKLGESMTLSFALDNSFVIREVRFAGVYEYPVSDEVLDRIVLTDVDTARALNGYIYGAVEKATVDPQTQALLDTSLDSIFNENTDVLNGSKKGVNLSDVNRQMADKGQKTASQTVEGAWNFLLLHTEDRDALKSKLIPGLGPTASSLQVRDWRETAGGNAQIVWLIRLLFNAGIIFIVAGACLIVINSLSLSIVERTKEIGTMRALGAQKGLVAQMITYETLILVAGAGFLGVLAGIATAQLTALRGVRIDNQFLSGLFGSNLLRLQVSWAGVLEHLGLCLLLGLASVFLPVRRALKIEPIRAMSREA